MINDLPVQSIVRQPRAIIQINGIQAPFESFEITQPTYYEADTFELTLASSAFPDELDEDFWANNQAFLVNFYAGFPPYPNNYSINDLDLLLTAQVDDLDIDDPSGEFFLSGRSLAAKFVDNKTTEKFQNHTSSQIAQILSKREGLKAVVTPTTTPVEIYYNIDHVLLSDERTEWDILTYLAQKEDYLLYVEGTTLYFMPKPKPTDDPYVVQYKKPTVLNGSPEFNGTLIKYHKPMAIARNLIVHVKTWNSKQKRAFTVTAKAVPNKRTYISSKAQPIGDAQTLSFTYGGLSKQQALEKAQQILRENTQHQRNIEVEMPADNLIKKNNIIKLQGAREDFNQIYYPSRVTRRMSMSEGYSMTIEAKNSDPTSTIVI